MDNIKWDLKSNYILALTVCKYGSICDCWNHVANDLAFYIKTTPENCKKQFDYLCQEYGQDWQQQANESLHNYIFSIVKRAYYGDLYARMTESRELLMVMYDFIRLFRCGKITSNDINMILQDIRNNVPSDNTTEYSEQQKRIKMLERLKFHMVQQMSQTPSAQPSTFPVELLPPPPPFLQQQQSLLNDRQVPSIANHLQTNGTELSSFPKIIQTTNLLADERNQINEVELSSDDDNDRPTTNSNPIVDHDESTFLSDEQMETTISSNILPLTNETIDNSLSNPSTDETKFSINGHSTSSNVPVTTSTNGSNDVATLDSGQTENHRDDSIESQSTDTTPRRISIDDDEVARMDAEQVPEIIPTDITNVPLTNDNAIFAVDDFDSITDQQKMSTIDQQQDLTSENNGVIKNKSERQKPRFNYSSTSVNFRKIVNSILSNLKTAKYGPDFTKSLKSFRLSDDYYSRIKNPIDIPEIRERMTNGGYDENFLQFERDVLLMLTNALLNYDREHDIHGHARYMIDYAMELFTPVEEAHNPWITVDSNDNNGDLSSICQTDHGNDTDDDTLNTRTPSIASTSSSVYLDSSMANLRRSRTFNHHSISKRQRKTLH